MRAVLAIERKPCETNEAPQGVDIFGREAFVLGRTAQVVEELMHTGDELRVVEQVNRFGLRQDVVRVLF